MPEKLTISASLEDYLEAIYHTVEEKGAARAKDIVQRMGVHNSSVTQALRSLSEKNLVNYAPYDVVTLTDGGQRIALDVVKRHRTLSAFLSTVLGLPEPEADEGACLMEHSISGKILERLVKFVEYFENCPLNDVMWDDEMGFFCGKSNDEKDGHSCGRDGCGPGLDLSGLVPLAGENNSKTEE
jgi:DtxR family Mn-dependent transcriptional regulator